ncbi:MAG: hypothetical protein K2L45_10060 [Muribaculaceae bacterium]|nr:hypothetical protein [Muribaculaceae bacterium]
MNGCNNGSDTIRTHLDLAELLMESHPDSALSIINSISANDITKKSEKARFALLKSMALDKNYVDTTTFDILQPAIDYYLKKGNADEKLRTYYYQGRIYQNKNECDSAVLSFMRGLDVAFDGKDSLTVARTLVAQATIYQSFYDIDGYTNNSLKAASIYRKKHYKSQEFECLLHALNGMNILRNEEQADSIIKILTQFDFLDNSQKRKLYSHLLTYNYLFGSNQDLKELIKNTPDSSYYNVNGILNLAHAYNRIGDNNMAIHLLDNLNKSNATYDTLKYLSIKIMVLENLKDYEGAFSTYKNFSHRLEVINANKFEQKSQSIEEKHNMELQAERESRKHLQQSYGYIGGILLLLLSLIIMALLLRSNKAKKNLAVQTARAAELENENLKSEKERLSLENSNLQLERDKKALEAENLAHRVEVLEGESDSLKALLDTPDEIPAEVQQAIKTRIEMLNSLLAGYITDNSKYEEPYDIWVKQLTDNTAEFMNSNRLAFQASHPKFIRYFEEHGLTESEINYVCLYAIGLRGKEVGNYMKKRSHVNISSAIRKKLGIDKHDTNIGIYVRKLLKTL